MLSAKTQYAIHALTYLGEHYNQGPIPIAQIAEQRKIPYKFLEAILLEMRKTGILGSKAGKNGGYYLIRAPEEVPMVDVIRQMEGPISLLPCVSKKFYESCRLCPHPEPGCMVRQFFLDVRNATLHAIEGKFLNELLSSNKNNTKN